MENVTPEATAGKPLRYAKCPHCNGDKTYTVELLTTGTHYGKRFCIDCERFMGFEPKPDEERKRRPSAARNLVRRHEGTYCQMCLRWGGQLPRGQAIEAHHVIPHSKREALAFGFAEAGDDSEKNIWILCTACHRLVDWRRDYRDPEPVMAEP